LLWYVLTSLSLTTTSTPVEQSFFQDNLGKPVPEMQKPFWIVTKQEVMGWQWHHWTIRKLFAPRSRQITMPVHTQVGCCLVYWFPVSSVRALKALLVSVYTIWYGMIQY